MANNADLFSLNNKPELDFFHKFHNMYNDPDINDSPYLNITISSLFHDPSSLINVYAGVNTPLFLSINIQSLHSKHESLLTEINTLLLNNINIQLIAIQETWDIHHPELLSLPGFQPFIYKKRVGMRGGGVGFYIKNGILATIIEEMSPFENKIFESLTLHLTLPDNKTLYVTSIYRSNGAIQGVTQSIQMQRFMAHLNMLLANISRKKCSSFVFLDANIDLLSIHNNQQSVDYFDSVLANGYLQLIGKATRMQNNSSTLLDHILSNTKCNTLTSGTIISDVSDHFFTFTEAPYAQKLNKSRQITSRNFTAEKLEQFRTELAAADWNPVFDNNDVDASYNEFWQTYKLLYDNCFPLITKKFNCNIHKIQDFMSNEILASRQTKIQLHKAFLTDPSPVNLASYKTHRNLYQKAIRTAKKQHYGNKIRANSGNPKKTWETLNEILGRKTGAESIDKININGIPVTTPINIASHFNDFFTKIGTKISESVLPVMKNAEDYVVYDHVFPDMNLTNTTPEHILKIIKGMQPKNSNDIDGQSTKLIKLIGLEISCPLAHIFNLSLSSGNFPSKLKQCRVIPIFKSGSRLECDNYRPISLLNSISKVLEKIVCEKLIYHLETNNLLYVHQYGFLPNRSTEQNLLQITKYITEALNDKMLCVGVFLDLKKAFDVCSHEILLKKLEKMGIRGIAHKWFKNYLAGRSQRVDIQGFLSEALNIDISVIQGSNLGPLLFLCYINDLWRATSLLSVLFADDTACLAKHRNMIELRDFVNLELKKIANWFRSNKMAVNTSKTKFIIFRTRCKEINNADCGIVFNGNELGQPEDPNLIFPIDRIHDAGSEKSFKLLGVHFDEYLSFNAHIDFLCAKISKSLFCINRVKNILEKSSLRQIYLSLVHSNIVYCINVYGSANKTALDRLELKQRKAIRTITNSTYRAHTAPLFVDLQILPLTQLITLNNLTFMHKYVHNKLPISFAGMWQTNRQRNPDVVLRNADKFYIPPHHYETLKKLPLFYFPSLWNDEDDILSPIRHRYEKIVKRRLLSSLT